MKLQDATEPAEHERSDPANDELLEMQALRERLMRAVTAVASRLEATQSPAVQPPASEPQPAEAEEDKPMSVRDAWLAFLIFGVGAKGISLLVWGSDEPGWFDFGYAVMFVVCVWNIIAAHIRAINSR